MIRPLLRFRLRLPHRVQAYTQHLGGLSLMVLFASMISSCDIAPLEIPERYDGANFAANTAAEMGYRSHLAALETAMEAGRTVGTLVDSSDLATLYTTDPALDDISTLGFRNFAFIWLGEVAQASANTFDPDNAPDGTGGLYGNYLLGPAGLEYQQYFEKGLYGAALFHRAVNLLEGDVTPATVDQLVALFGAHPDFANSYDSDIHSHPDVLLAAFAASRDPNDGNGLYTTLRDAFIKLQAAVSVETPETYVNDQAEAITTLYNTWEKVFAATIIHYLGNAQIDLGEDNTDESTLAEGLHAYSQAVGLLRGLYSVNFPMRQLTDKQIQSLLTNLKVDLNGNSTAYEFITSASNELIYVQDALDELQDAFGFTNEEMESFQQDWVAVQGR